MSVVDKNDGNESMSETVFRSYKVKVTLFVRASEILWL
jgi:hypothetical protein